MNVGTLDTGDDGENTVMFSFGDISNICDKKCNFLWNEPIYRSIPEHRCDAGHFFCETSQNDSVQ